MTTKQAKVKTNRDRLVAISVMGEVSAPKMRAPYRVGHDGVARVGPATGGIVYNVRVGDPAFGWAGDHVEPGVSTKEPKDEHVNMAYNTLSCLGNTVRVVSGDAKGATGVVTGKHGGVEHVIVDFEPETLEKLVIGDKVLVRAYGQGLEVEGFPGVKVYNLAPDLFEKMGPEVVGEGDDRRLSLPVTAEIPAQLMGSGLGSMSASSGDYDMTTQEPSVLAELGLDRLRLGDIVAIKDASAFYGWSYRRGAVIIGVVVHSDSKISGHGPGITTLLTANHGEILPRLDSGANLALLLGLRSDIRPAGG
jgi:hypothetical protein